MKKLTSVLLVIAMLIMQIPMTFAATGFSDVRDSDWFADSVTWAVSNNITKGTSDTTFSPDQVCTRGQIVTFLWRAAGQPAPTSTDNPFTDVSKSDYFYSAVLWAVEKNVTKGATATTFAPDSYCTREQAVAFMHRAEGSPKPLILANQFTDMPPDAWSLTSVLWAVGNGITNGTTGSTFSPAQNCTRAQIVAFLYRMKTVTPPTVFLQVAFAPNGGSWIPTQPVGAGRTVIRPQDPTRSGYRFLGWYKDMSLTIKYDFNEPVYSSFSLYAKWENVLTAHEYLVDKILKEGYPVVDGCTELDLRHFTQSGTEHFIGIGYDPSDGSIYGYTEAVDSTDKYFFSLVEIPAKCAGTYYSLFNYEMDYTGESQLDPTKITPATTSITFSSYNGQNKTTMQKIHAVNVKLMLEAIRDKAFAGTKYTLADLGFTAYK